jgi:hypothetical protein
MGSGVGGLLWVTQELNPSHWKELVWVMYSFLEGENDSLFTNNCISDFHHIFPKPFI